MKILKLGLTELADQPPQPGLTKVADAPLPIPIRIPAQDEFGRPAQPIPAPMIGGTFLPRVRDRWSTVMPPWSPEQIVNAYQAAERGDMTMQSELFEHMEDRDGALEGFMQTRRLAPCGVKWSIEQADDSTEAEAVADFVRREIAAIPGFRISYRDLMDAIGKSIAASWIDWQPGGRNPETQWRIDGIHHINPKRYRFHWRREEFLILPDLSPLSDQPAPIQPGQSLGQQPPPWKVVIHRTHIKSGHPAKAGVLRLCGLYFLLRNYALKDAAVYADVFGMPLRVGKYPDGASDDDKERLAQAVELLGTDAAAIISKVTEIDLLESKSRTGGGMPYFDLHKTCEQQMQLAILGQDQTNTHNPTGGRTQVAEGGAKVRQDLLEADCIDIEETLTQQLIRPIVGFSRFGWEMADRLCPKFKLHYEPPTDEEGAIAVDVPLMTVIGFPQTYGQIAKRYNRELPDGVDPNEVIKPIAVQQAEQAAAQAQQETKAAAQGAGKSFARTLTELLTMRAITGSGAQLPIDRMGDAATSAGEDAVIPMAHYVATIFDGSKSLEEFQQRLRKAFDDMDASELEQLVRRSTFVARLYGRAVVKR